MAAMITLSNEEWRQKTNNVPSSDGETTSVFNKFNVFVSTRAVLKRLLGDGAYRA